MKGQAADGLPLFHVTAPVQLSRMPTLDTLITRFRGADRNTRLETLLDYSRKLPPLPPEYEALKAQGKNLVPECQTPVYLWIGIENGKVRLARRRATRVADRPRVRRAPDQGAGWPVTAGSGRRTK